MVDGPAAATERIRALRRELPGEPPLLLQEFLSESQEIVELCLKALLRSARIVVPRIHDVSKILRAEVDRLPEAARRDVDRLAEISHSMRRDRELAFWLAGGILPGA